MAKPYKFKLLSPSVLGVEFKTRADMAIMFMRVAEDSGIGHGQLLTEGDTLIEYRRKHGAIYYKDRWDGFNVTGETIRELTTQLGIVGNKYEKDLIKECFTVFGKDHELYFVGAFSVIAYRKGDKATRKHELHHARFYLSEAYRKKVWTVLGEQDLRKARKYLKKEGYNLPNTYEGTYNLIDETNAYTMTDTKDVVKQFNLSKSVLKQLKKLSKEYVKT